MLKFLILFFGLLVIGKCRMPLKYSDYYARHKLWPLSNLFYNTSLTPQDYMDQCFYSSKFYKLVHLPCDLFNRPNTTIMCTGAVAVSNDEEAVLLFFQGTIGTPELSEELTFYNITTSFPGGGTVAKFWYNGFQILWNDGLRDALFSAKNTYPSYELWVFGWSMGGCISANAAPYISQLGYYKPADIKMVTFGQTRVGDEIFAKRFPSLVPYAYRVTHYHDIAPHLIPEDGGQGYRHVKNEIWYPNWMVEGDTYIECDIGESMNCSDSVPKDEWSWLDHEYFPLEGKFGICKKEKGY